MKHIFVFGIILFLISFLGYTLTWSLTIPNLHGMKQKASKVKDEIPNINEGGCGWFALYASDYFDKINVPYQIVYVTSIGDEKNNIPHHVMLRIEDQYFFDADGLHQSSYLIFYGGIRSYHTKKDLTKILHESGWNHEFNKNDTTIIKDIIWNH